MSVKRVFAIIGIVVGCIAAFVGGVIGVYALMGKFKTPVVKPEKLYFENPEQVVVAQYKDDDGKDVIYSFNLKAENNSIDHEVNVRECFIWFEKGIGEELIQLCDKDGNLLTADSKKRYAVNCNETLYFKIKVFYNKYEYNSSTWDKDCKRLFIIQDGKYVLNESEEYDSSLIYYTMQTYEEKYSSLDLSSLINGKVVLRARTADDTVQTSQDLVVWVDRNVSSIFLNYGDIPTEITEKSQVQSVNIGVDKEVEFNYVVNPEISLQPISKESKKIVELYYNDPKSEDFVLVNLENIKNTTKYSLYKIFDETKCVVNDLTGELKLVFRSSVATNEMAHYFKIAIFPSYNAGAEFLANENNLSVTNFERLQHMVTTDLYVQVVNINIDRVTLSDGELNLNLFTNNNDVYLRNEEAETLNLNVEMFAGDDKLDVRFDELDFKTITDSKNILNTNPKFLAEQTVEVNEINFSECLDIVFSKENNLLSFTINEKDFVCSVDSTISIGDYAIINTITDNSNDVTYSCNNGVALVYIGDDANAKTVTMLNVGSYLEFYIYDSITQTYTLAKDYVYDTEEETYVGDITYSVTPSGQYANKQWNIVVESVSNDITNGTKTLVLGLLVVNNEGGFHVDKLFAKKPVIINVQDIHYEVKNSTTTLNLLATNEGFISEDAGKDFDFFVNVDEGTYNACVFVISENDIDFTVVDYVEKLYYIDTKGTEDTSDDEKFYVVGYFDGNNFVNKIRTINNSKVTKETESKLQMLQLKNVYNETASGVIARIINDSEKNIATTEVDISANVQKLFKTNISVKQNLVIDDSVEFSVLVDPSEEPEASAVENDVKDFYTGTTHILKITTPSNPTIITRLCEFYGIVKTDNSLDTAFILNNYPQNANITGQLIDTEDKKVLVLTVNVGELLSSDVNVEIKLANVFTGVRTEETLSSFNIVDSAPTSIVYNGKDVEGNPISIILTENQVNAPVITAEITWEGGDYKYNWYINYGEEGQKEINEIELNNATAKDSTGFQDKDFKILQGITYSLSNNAISRDGTSLSINSVTDNTYLSVTIAGVTRYLKINVVQVGFSLTQTNLAIDKEVGYLNDSGIVDYKYNDTSVYNNAINDIQLRNINVLYTNSKAGTLKVYETEIVDGDGNKTYTYPYIYKYEFEDGSSPSTILTITKDTDKKDWKFAREDDKYAALSVSFNVVTKTQTLDCSVKFTSGIEYEYNASAWGVTPKLYQNTEILLYEIKTNDGAFDFEPLIKIRNKSQKIIEIESNKGSLSENVLGLSDLGEYSFKIIAKVEEADVGEVIETLTFKVVPNIVVKQDSATNLILDSGSDDVSTTLYNNIRLYSYKISYIYGKDKDTDNGNKIILYSTEFDIETGGAKTPILEEKTNDLKSSVLMQSKEKTENNELYINSYVENVDGSDVTKIKTAWIDLIGEMQEVNVVVKSGNYEVGTFTAIVKNNNKVVTDGLTITSDNVLNLKAMLGYAGKFKIEDATLKDLFTLSEIKWAYSDEHSNGTYPNTSSEIPTLNKRFDNVNLILTFKGIVNGEEKTLIFNGKTINEKDLTINVVPFEFEDSDNINKAFSEQTFNLLTDVYNTPNIDDEIKINDYFNYIKVLSVKDENGNSLIPDNLNLGFAYNYANLSNGLIITFNKLYADSVKALIEYEVQYAGSTETYTYKKAITLQNWQELQVKYPENEVVTDADKYLTIEEITLSNGVKYVNQQYEAVVIDNLDSYTIDLKDIQNKNISRITAKDRTDGSTKFTTDYKIESLEILAYENTINFSTYVKTYGNIELNKNNATITFKNYSQNFSRMIAFRLTTTTGNSIEYFVQVTCLGGNTAVYGNKKVEKDAVYTSGTSVSDLVDNFGENFIKTNFNNVTKFDATKVKMFLLNATVLASDNKMFVGDIVNETIVGTAPDQIIYSGERYTDVGNCTLTINDYTTITLSLIYYDSENGYVYPIGILTLYLRPTGAVNSQSTGFKDVYSLVNKEGIENGEFKYTIPANTSPIAFPTDFSVAQIETGKKHILDSNGELVTGISGIGINSNDITIVNQVTDAKKFTIFYKHIVDGYTIKVTYTLQKVDIKAGSTHTIGKFDKDLNKFDDTFVIDAVNYKKYFGTYQGQIKIGNATFTVGVGYKFSATNTTGTITSGVTYAIDNGVLTLTFEQGLYDETKEIDVYYTNLSVIEEEKTITYTFNVKRGLDIKIAEGGNSGLNSSDRKTTETEETIDYTDDAGSILTIKKFDISGGVKYEFAGYTIYIKNSSGLINFEFKAEDENYVLSDVYNNTKKIYEQIVDSPDKSINFVHMPTETNKTIDVTFTISNGSEEFKTDASTVDTRTLYLTIAETYQQVVAVYLTEDASAENVVKGTTINKLQDYLFTPIKEYSIYVHDGNDDAWNLVKNSLYKYDYDSDSYVQNNDAEYNTTTNYYFKNISDKRSNDLRLKLKDLNGNDVDSDINFAGMGFTDSTNPNFINFTLGNGSKATLTLNADNTQNIRFDDSITANEKCIVYLDNLAGMPTVDYVFQIMADNKVDGFTFSNEGHPDETENYMAFDFDEKKDDDASVAYSTGKLKIGTIKDGLSKGVYVLKNGNWVFLPKAGSDDERILPFTNVSIEIAENSQGTHPASRINCSYDVILDKDSANNANWDIYINFHRSEGVYHLPDMVTINLSIHGTSGYILNNLKVVLFNTEIGPKDKNIQSINGGETFDILNHSKYGLKVPTGVDLRDVSFDLVYDLSMVGESGHAINTPLSSYKYDTNKNSLVEFDPTTNMLTTKTVGKNVNINLVFRVKIGGYYLNNVTYQIQLRRSIQFFFNGDQPVIDKDGKWETNNVTSYATNFVLTNYYGSNATNFGPEMKFSYYYEDTTKQLINGETYYTKLCWEIKNLCGSSPIVDINIDPSQESLYDEGILVVDETGITFLKDYTGEFKLILTVNLLNEFNYTVSWTINVFGILDIQPQYKTDDEGLTSSSMPYNSGQNVDLLSDSASDSTGLYLKDMEDVFDAAIDYDETTANKLKTTYQYAIIKYDPYDGLNNQQRFEDDKTPRSEIVGDKKKADGTEDNADVVLVGDRTLELPLPVVPRTGSEESYLVIYKINISYLGYTSKTYYVAYKVVHNLNISVTALKHGDNTNFDVDNIDVCNRLTDNKYLDLFYYTETYTHTTTGSKPVTTNYILRLTNIDADGNATYQARENGGTFNVVKIENTSNANQLRLSKDNGTTWITITKSTVSTENESYWKITTGIGADEKVTNASLFTVNFNNITEFAKLINDIDGIVIKQPTVEYKFKVDHIANGRWGIDLSNWNGKVNPGDVLFKNKLEDAEFIIRADSGQTIYSIDKYNSQQNTGFRLSAGVELTARGKFTVSQLFVESNLKDLSAYKDYEVIGVYTGTWNSSNTWVNNGTPQGNPGSTIATINVPTGTKDAENNPIFISYELKAVTYKGDDKNNISGICKVEDEFCLIYCASGAAIYKMNLDAMSSAGYEIGKDTIVSLTGNSLDAKFIKFANDNSGVFKIDTNAKITEIAEQGTDIHSNDDGTDNKFTGSGIKDNSITMLESDLIAYKNQNPEQKFLAITYSVKFGDVQLQCTINYKLPSLSTVVDYQNTLATNDKVVITGIYVPDKTSATGYTKLENYLGVIGKEVTSIVENGSNYTVQPTQTDINGGFKKDADGKYTGEIELNKEAVDNYFNTHTTAKFLEIKYTITTKTENKSESIDFVIVVRRGSST